MKVAGIDLDPFEFRKRAGVQPEHVVTIQVFQKLMAAKHALNDFFPYTEEESEERADLQAAQQALGKLLGHFSERGERHRLEQAGAPQKSADLVSDA